MIQRHWRGIEARSRVSAQLEMELLALQAEDDDHLSYCGGPPDDDSTDETADETLVDGATAERTESDALFAQLEAEAEAEIAAVRASRMHFSPTHTHLNYTKVVAPCGAHTHNRSPTLPFRRTTLRAPCGRRSCCKSRRARKETGLTTVPAPSPINAM